MKNEKKEEKIDQVYSMERNLKMRTKKKVGVGRKKKQIPQKYIPSGNPLWIYYLLMCICEPRALCARKSCEEVIAVSADAGEFKIGNLFYDFRGVIKMVCTIY